MDGGLKARCHVRDSWWERMGRAYSPQIGFLRVQTWDCSPGWYGSHRWCWGRVQPPGLSKGHRSGWFEGHRPGWFEGQRPGLIPAYGIAIGFGHRNGWRAEGPVSFPVSLARTDGSGLQPSNRFDVPIPGAVPQAGIVRTVGAGGGENGESTPMDANGAVEEAGRRGVLCPPLKSGGWRFPPGSGLPWRLEELHRVRQKVPGTGARKAAASRRLSR